MHSSKHRNTLQLRLSAVHYMLAAVVFTIYGIQVCPLLETLTLIHLVSPILVALIGRYLWFNFIVRNPSEPCRITADT